MLYEVITQADRGLDVLLVRMDVDELAIYLRAATAVGTEAHGVLTRHHVLEPEMALLVRSGRDLVGSETAGSARWRVRAHGVDLLEVDTKAPGVV